MNLRNWFRMSRKNRPLTRSRSTESKRVQRCRPTVEMLEDRSLPSAYMVTTTADSC